MAKLSQTELALRSTVHSVLYTKTGSAPTTTDDRNKRFIVGSRWINTATTTEYVCVDNTPTAAVWKDTTAAGGGGVSAVEDTVDPTTDDDTHDIGTIWINTTADTAFVCTHKATGAAVWVSVSGGSGGGGGVSALSVAVCGIGTARNSTLFTPQVLYDGNIDGCQNLNNTVSPTTTYVVSSGALTNTTDPVDSTSSATVSALQEYGDGYRAAQAVDNNHNTRWSGSTTSEDWFKFDFGTGVTKQVSKVTVWRSNYDGGYTPTLQYSDNDTDWTTAATGPTLAASPPNDTSYDITNTDASAHRYWRIHIPSSTTASVTWNEVKIYTYQQVASPVYLSTAQALAYQPTKAGVAIVAKLGAMVLNTDFVAQVSSNGGTNWETVTLAETGTAPYATGTKNYTALVSLVDRGTQNMTIKITGTSTAHTIYGVALVCIP